ncbi:TetR/AcrR family transcriptional regulator [Glycomyces buryatensis]|uniref:TetR/AcrR family transcriptional regulator n=1 Tax=Glycomyces buryatensis TaxID=2570927 RepID=A0A4V4HQF9_9ACTN|nr:TetR/AcrR family transcriptional regulator [Glycomyces buryatensis]THV33676.1 TetR/AcrR family transcriptional regulator [Glycomyces buryatensis]
MTAATKRRYATGVARQEELLDAAYELFAAAGFSGVSLRAIAAKAGVSHAALLRYFTSKDDLLFALLNRWEAANFAWIEAHAELPRPEAMVGLARRNAATPGYVPLFAALTGEAVTAAHPAHEHMRRRYESLRHYHDDDRDVVRLTSVWDGLQVMSLYLDEVEVPAALAAHFARTPESGADLDAEPRSEGDGLVRLPEPPPADESGYARGRESKTRIIDSATELFAGGGFTQTSLSDIAMQVGTSKSSLLHHFGSKDALLAAVLAKRDERAGEDPREPVPPREHLRRLVQGARNFFNDTATTLVSTCAASCRGPATMPSDPASSRSTPSSRTRPPPPTTRPTTSSPAASIGPWTISRASSNSCDPADRSPRTATHGARRSGSSPCGTGFRCSGSTTPRRST